MIWWHESYDAEGPILTVYHLPLSTVCCPALLLSWGLGCFVWRLHNEIDSPGSSSQFGEQFLFYNGCIFVVLGLMAVTCTGQLSKLVLNGAVNRIQLHKMILGCVRYRTSEYVLERVVEAFMDSKNRVICTGDEQHPGYLLTVFNLALAMESGQVFHVESCYTPACFCMPCGMCTPEKAAASRINSFLGRFRQNRAVQIYNNGRILQANPVQQGMHVPLATSVYGVQS